jgi:uncharacterized membrane protein YphA (DoxX/SURF4 family)
MNSATRVFLVLMRLAIGWHFLFEGLEKIQSVELGPTETNRPWSSAAYLRESTGPLAGFFRRQVGDPDEQALARLVVTDLPAGQDRAGTPSAARLPSALEREWDDYFERYWAHYDLDEKGGRPGEREKVDRIFDEQKQAVAKWLLKGTKKATKTFPSGTVEVEETTPQRVEEYRQFLAEVARMEQQALPAFGHDVYKDKLLSAKADVRRARTELLKDLDEQTAHMRSALAGALTSARLAAAGPVPAPPQFAPAERIDWLTRWGLTAIGACLLLGIFTRTACVAGALFLMMVYLTMPPFPWVPEPLRTEGHYLFVNKNLIEMLALLTLATTRSGCWAGLDGVLQFLWPKRREIVRAAREMQAAAPAP